MTFLRARFYFSLAVRAPRFGRRKNGDLGAARNRITALLFGRTQSMTSLFADTLKQRWLRASRW